LVGQKRYNLEYEVVRKRNASQKKTLSKPTGKELEKKTHSSRLLETKGASSVKDVPWHWEEDPRRSKPTVYHHLSLMQKHARKKGCFTRQKAGREAASYHAGPPGTLREPPTGP